ncbi:DUF397 domain-containing protein [Streptomyces zingiberis]|uniref:DUF397 domain-containing protein n=1 Tax=Streptomyces zingiberis TaxID=2053010 RepID=A0ABX1C051_9ACTN|nr:DUF397 domain-containing protein [Streptomyces zingiberis]NJQ03300.1 DUF397 domain-containing protein [Streptomyces zingiberis]
MNAAAKAELYAYDLTEAIWRKGSASGPEHNCVEVAGLPGGGKAIRDSKRHDAAPLRCTASAWQAFRHGVLTGEL